MSRVKQVCVTVDKLGASGEGFTSKDVLHALPIGATTTWNTVTATLNYLYKRGIILRGTPMGKTLVYMLPKGMTATEGHQAWIKASALTHKGPPQRRGPREPEAGGGRLRVEFPLGEWRHKHIPQDPPRYARGGL